MAAYQMILPGEKAPSHRHTAHALRVIIDAKGRLLDRRRREDADGDGRRGAHARAGAGTSTAMTATSRPIGSTGSTCRSCKLEAIFFEDIPTVRPKTGRWRPRPTAFRATRSRAARRGEAPTRGFHGPRVCSKRRRCRPWS